MEINDITRRLMLLQVTILPPHPFGMVPPSAAALPSISLPAGEQAMVRAQVCAGAGRQHRCVAGLDRNMTAESRPRPTRKPTGAGRIARESAACSACHLAGCSEVTSFLWLFRGYLVSREDDEDVRPTRMRPTRNVKMS